MITALLFILQVADGITTVKILDRGGYERNPVIERLFTWAGVKPTLIIKGLAVTAIGGWLEISGYGLIAGLLAAWYWYVVINNLRLLKWNP